MPAHGHKQVQQWAGRVLVSRLWNKTGLLDLHVYLLAVTQYFDKIPQMNKSKSSSLTPISVCLLPGDRTHVSLPY